jgi:hypothetical protein
MEIPLGTRAYWDYYDAMGKLLDQFFRTLAGGQFVTRGTDIMSPELKALASVTIANYEKMGSIVDDIVSSLKETLAAQGG